MQEHHGQILKEILQRLGVDAEKLSNLTNGNKASVKRLFQSPGLKWRTITTIGQLLGYDFSPEFPELSKQGSQADASIALFNSDMQNFSNVFLVDDSELDTFVFRLIFKKAVGDLQISTFSNGEEAINKLLEIAINQPESLPQHIFLDLKMPVMDGAQFLEQFHRLNIDPEKKIRIYVLTSSVFLSDIHTFLVHPLVNMVLKKPVELTAIKDLIINL